MLYSDGHREREDEDMERELSNCDAEDLRRDRVAALAKVLERIDEAMANEEGE